MRAPLLWLMACTPPVELAPVATPPERTCACDPDPACPPELAEVAIAPVLEAEDAMFAVRAVLDNLREMRALATLCASESLPSMERSGEPNTEFLARIQWMDEVAPTPDLTAAAFGIDPDWDRLDTMWGARVLLPRLDAAQAVALARVRAAEAALAVVREEAALAYPSCALPAAPPPTPEADLPTWAAVVANADATLEILDVVRGTNELVAEALRRVKALANAASNERTSSERAMGLSTRLRAWVEAGDALAVQGRSDDVLLTSGVDTGLDVQITPSGSLYFPLPDLRATILGVDTWMEIWGPQFAMGSRDQAAAALTWAHGMARRSAAATRDVRGYRDEARTELASATPEPAEICTCEVEIACPGADAEAAAAPILAANAAVDALEATWAPLTEMHAWAVRYDNEALGGAGLAAAAAGYDAARARLATAAAGVPESYLLTLAARPISTVQTPEDGLSLVRILIGQTVSDARLAHARSAARWPRCPLPEAAHADGYTLEASWSAVADNIVDGEGAVDVARSAADAIDARLVRMREIAVAMAGGGLTARARRRNEADFVALSGEINDRALSTTWAGVSLTDGSMTTMDIQVGIWNIARSRLVVALPDLRASVLGVDTATSSVATPEMADLSLTPIDAARDMVRTGVDRLVAADETFDLYAERAAGVGRQRTASGDW